MTNLRLAGFPGALVCGSFADDLARLYRRPLLQCLEADVATAFFAYDEGLTLFSIGGVEYPLPVILGSSLADE
jgi:hypothetical protein